LSLFKHLHKIWVKFGLKHEATVDARAQSPVDVLIIRPDRLRALLIAESSRGLALKK